MIERVGKRIERCYPRYLSGIDNDPAGEGQELRHNEIDRADKTADRVCDGLSKRTSLYGLILHAMILSIFSATAAGARSLDRIIHPTGLTPR